jgi:hypothetical protein
MVDEMGENRLKGATGQAGQPVKREQPVTLKLGYSSPFFYISPQHFLHQKHTMYVRKWL